MSQNPEKEGGLLSAICLFGLLKGIILPVPPGCTTRNFKFCTQTGFVCFVRILGQTAKFAVYIINRFVSHNRGADYSLRGKN
jgi:hypothetical protein